MYKGKIYETYYIWWYLDEKIVSLKNRGYEVGHWGHLIGGSFSVYNQQTYGPVQTHL